MFVDKYQRVFRSDGQWVKRNNYPLKIPIRESFTDAYQTLYYKKTEIFHQPITTITSRMLVEFFFDDGISDNPSLGVLFEHIGIQSLFNFIG